MKVIFIKYIIISIFFSAVTVWAENETDSAASRLYPEKRIIYTSIDINGLKNLIKKRLDESPELGASSARIRSAENQIESMEASFLPTVNATAGYSYYRSRHRDETVNKRVPVKWDNDNPIISNIKLPNGGQGIIWLPRPLAWDYRDIPVVASIDYSDRSFRSNVGLSYKLPFGMVISPFSYSMDYRFAPKSYGLPWTGTLSSNLFMPLFKNMGWYGSSEHIDLEITQISKEISSKSEKIQYNNIIYTLLANYFSLYFENSKVKIMEELEKNLNIQIKDVDILNSEGRITVTEKISTESKQRNIKYETEYSANRIVYYSTMLDNRNIDEEEIFIYSPKFINESLLCTKVRSLFKELIKEESLKKLIENHPGVDISELALEQSRINVLFAENQDRPEINLTGSVQTYEGPQYNLGYHSPGTALLKSLSDPDGIFWSLGLQYNLPTGKPDKFNLIAAQAELEAGENDLKSAKRSVSDRLKQHIFQISNSIESVDNAKDNLDMVQEIHDKEALPLFQAKRLNRFDYYSYLNQVLNAKIGLVQARQQLMSDFFSFVSDMQIDWKKTGRIIE